MFFCESLTQKQNTMKIPEIRFFSHEENESTKVKEEVAIQPTGYISATGKIIITQSTADEVGLKPSESAFRVGMPENKRKLKSLYVIPTQKGEDGVFEMTESGRNYFIALGVILENSGVDFRNNKYTFDINPFQYDGDVTGYELKLDQPIPKIKRADREVKG